MNVDYGWLNTYPPNVRSVYNNKSCASFRRMTKPRFQDIAKVKFPHDYHKCCINIQAIDRQSGRVSPLYAFYVKLNEEWYLKLLMALYCNEILNSQGLSIEKKTRENFAYDNYATIISNDSQLFTENYQVPPEYREKTENHLKYWWTNVLEKIKVLILEIVSSQEYFADLLKSNMFESTVLGNIFDGKIGILANHTLYENSAYQNYDNLIKTVQLEYNIDNLHEIFYNFIYIRLVVPVKFLIYALEGNFKNFVYRTHKSHQAKSIATRVTDDEIKEYWKTIILPFVGILLKEVVAEKPFHHIIDNYNEIDGVIDFLRSIYIDISNDKKVEESRFKDPALNIYNNVNFPYYYYNIIEEPLHQNDLLYLIPRNSLLLPIYEDCQGRDKLTQIIKTVPWILNLIENEQGESIVIIRKTKDGYGSDFNTDYLTTKNTNLSLFSENKTLVLCINEKFMLNPMNGFQLPEKTCRFKEHILQQEKSIVHFLIEQ